MNISGQPAARFLMGSTFALLGLDAAREPGVRVEMAGPTLSAIRKFAPLPENDALIVRANGVAQAAAGGMLALSIVPRTSAAVLGLTLIPTTLAGHAFWKAEDKGARKMQTVQFLKNSAILGGLLQMALGPKGK